MPAKRYDSPGLAALAAANYPKAFDGSRPKLFIVQKSDGYYLSKQGGPRFVVILEIPAQPPQYFRMALEAVLGREVPFDLPSYGPPKEEAYLELQDFCATHARPAWALGLSMIEAAELIVRQAIENANIPPEL